jgi:hypothetical protein
MNQIAFLTALEARFEDQDVTLGFLRRNWMILGVDT